MIFMDKLLVMKTKRNLSGIYFKWFNDDEQNWEPRCFEDLPEEVQDHYMKDRDIGWVKSLAKQLANTLNEIGEQFDIMKE